MAKQPDIAPHADVGLLNEAIKALGIDTPLYRVYQVDEDTVELTTPYQTVTYRNSHETWSGTPAGGPKRKRSRASQKP
jgi:hypothetical protein